MSKRTEIIPRAPIGRIMLNSGAKRVSAQAMNTLSDILTDIGEEISERAVRIAKHSGRKTVKGSDIKIASK